MAKITPALLWSRLKSRVIYPGQVLEKRSIYLDFFNQTAFQNGKMAFVASPHLQKFSEILNPPIVLQITGKPDVHERWDLEKGKKGYLVSAAQVLNCF